MSYISDSLSIIRRYKHKFSTNDYNKLLNLLYTELENNTDNNHLNHIMDFNLNLKDVKLNSDIIHKIYNYNINNPEDINNFEFRDHLLNLFPILNLILINNNLYHDSKIKTVLCEIPINNDYDKCKIVNDVKFLLKICDSLNGAENKIVVMLTIFDLLFRNFNFMIEHEQFKDTVKKKLVDIKKKDINVIKEFLNKFFIKEDIIDIWLSYL